MTIWDRIMRDRTISLHISFEDLIGGALLCGVVACRSIGFVRWLLAAAIILTFSVKFAIEKKEWKLTLNVVLRGKLANRWQTIKQLTDARSDREQLERMMQVYEYLVEEHCAGTRYYLRVAPGVFRLKPFFGPPRNIKGNDDEGGVTEE